MTNDKTVTMSRELACTKLGDLLNDLQGQYPSARIAEIQKLLAAPVVERQEPVAAAWLKVTDKGRGNEYELDWYGAAERLSSGEYELYTATPELAELQATIARLTAENERLKGGQGGAVALLERCLNALDSRVAASKSVRTLRMELRKFIQSVPHKHEWDINKEGTATICHCGARSSDFYAEPRATVTASPVARSLLATIEQLQATIGQQTYALSKTENLLNDMLRDDDMKAHWFRDRINACLDKVKELNQ